jgi:hypothetical protein
MNLVIKEEFYKSLYVENSGVILLEEGSESYAYTKEYFTRKDGGDQIYINDPVFLELQSQIFPMEKVKKELSGVVYMVFPILHDGDVKALFFLGKKRLNDYFSKTEIRILRYFSYFLS